LSNYADRRDLYESTYMSKYKSPTSLDNPLGGYFKGPSPAGSVRGGPYSVSHKNKVDVDYVKALFDNHSELMNSHLSPTTNNTYSTKQLSRSNAGPVQALPENRRVNSQVNLKDPEFLVNYHKFYK
jgi:hypothetical protein